MKNKRNAGMVFLATLALVGCSTADTQEEGKDGAGVATSAEESRVQAYLEQEDGKTDAEKIEEFRGKLEGLSKFYEGGFNYQFFMKAHKDSIKDDDVKLMYETYGSEKDGFYTLVVTQYNISAVGDLVQVSNQTLPQGNVYVQNNVIYDGTYVYEDVDALLGFTYHMIEDNPLVNDIRALLFEDGLAERVSKFEGNYKGYWLRSESDMYKQPVDAIRNYFSGLKEFATDKNTTINKETNTVILTLTQEQVKELNEGQKASYPLFYETYAQEESEDLTYELHYNLETKEFSTHLIAPEGSKQNSYFALLSPIGDVDDVVLPEEKQTIIETDKFYDDYTDMLGIKEDYLEEEIAELESGVTEEVVKVTGE